MGDIIEFERGCRGCVNLVQLDKGTFYCTECDWDNGDTIFPIKEGRKTSDWNACQGDSYERSQYRKANRRRAY